MPKLIIKGTPINIPDSGQSPNWAPAIIEAFEALSEAVNAVSGSFDVPPQVQNIDANNSSTNVEMNNLIFPSNEVRAATVYYSVYRKTEDSGPPDGEELTEAGTLELSYNESRPINQKWEIVRSGQGDAKISFNITDLGQVRFSTTTLTGDTSTHIGILSYRAISILNV
jgi:hypothetical protein